MNLGAPPAAGSRASARSGTSAAGWSENRERSNLFAVRLMAWIAVHLGRPIARWLLHPISLYFLCASPGPRRQSARYLARVFGRQATWLERYHHFHAFSAMVLDRVYFARQQLQRFDLQISGVTEMEAALDPQRGAILLGAHIGSFEVLHAVGGQHQLPVAMVMYPHNARTIHRVLQALAPGSHLGIIPIGSSGSTLAIRDWLDRGGLVGMLGDRLPPQESARQGELELPFLGRPARFSLGPLRLAMLLRRPVLFMSGLYLGGNRYRVSFEPLVDFSTPPADATSRDQQVHQALAAYVARLELQCRTAPTNWFNFYDFWGEDKPHQPAPH